MRYVRSLYLDLCPRKSIPSHHNPIGGKDKGETPKALKNDSYRNILCIHNNFHKASLDKTTVPSFANLQTIFRNNIWNSEKSKISFCWPSTLVQACCEDAEKIASSLSLAKHFGGGFFSNTMCIYYLSYYIHISYIYEYIMLSAVWVCADFWNMIWCDTVWYCTMKCDVIISKTNIMHVRNNYNHKYM